MFYCMNLAETFLFYYYPIDFTNPTWICFVNWLIFFLYFNVYKSETLCNIILNFGIHIFCDILSDFFAEISRSELVILSLSSRRV